ncbi:hypothetical protein [Kitasatospora sp. NPDC094015]|uniref:hypothetical protein n=1 Tax=Kitasatospora sp. NPDC094015 TaxID=3155205 RepID=UPI00331D8847
MPKYRGAHRITVTGAQSEWPQRAVVTVRGGRTVVVPGVTGASELIDAEDWDLAVEHEYRGVWQPSIRAVVGRWEDRGGAPSQLVRCTDRDGTGNPGGRSLVLRIDREDPRPPAAPEPATALRRATTESAARGRTPGPSAARTTSSDPGLPTVPTSTGSTGSAGFTGSGTSTTSSSGGW